MTRDLKQNTIDALISIWTHPDEILHFIDIHRKLVEEGIVKNEKARYQTHRILKKARQNHLIERVRKGQYRLNVELGEFKLFHYLQTLRQKGVNTELQVGGFLSSLSQMYCLGMPKNILNNKVAHSALLVLSTRIARIFEALKSLAKEEEQKIRGEIENTPFTLPSEIIRELLLEIVPYYLGSGWLSLDELNLVLPIMIQSLPNEVVPQCPTNKGLMLKHYILIKEILQYQQNNLQLLNDEGHGLFETKDFALIVTPPELLISTTRTEQRSIMEIIVESKTKSPLYIAQSLLSYEKENVVTILNSYGMRILGKGKLKQVIDHYEKMFASNHVALIMNSFKFYDEETKKEATKKIEELTEIHGFKTIIFYLPFTLSSHNFIIPTRRKERILQKFFPRINPPAIHNWLNEGVKLAEEVTLELQRDILTSFSKLLPREN